VARAEAYLHAKWHLDPSGHLATTDMGGKLGAAVPIFRVWELDPHVKQCGLGKAYNCSKRHLDSCSRLVTIHGPKLGRSSAPPFFGRGSGFTI